MYSHINCYITWLMSFCCWFALATCWLFFSSIFCVCECVCYFVGYFSCLYFCMCLLWVASSDGSGFPAAPHWYYCYVSYYLSNQFMVNKILLLLLLLSLRSCKSPAPLWKYRVFLANHLASTGNLTRMHTNAN